MTEQQTKQQEKTQQETTKQETEQTKQQKTSKQKKQGPTPYGTNRKQYSKLSSDKLQDIINRLQNNEKVTAKQYNQSQQTINKIRQELRKPRKEVEQGDPLPENYFLPKSIQHRVDNLLYDLGYTKIE